MTTKYVHMAHRDRDRMGQRRRNGISIASFDFTTVVISMFVDDARLPICRRRIMSVQEEMQFLFDNREFPRVSTS